MIAHCGAWQISTYQPAERSKLSLKIWHLLISKERSKNNVRRIIRGQIFIEHKTSHTDENHPHIIYFPFFGKENRWTRTIFSLLSQKKVKFRYIQLLSKSNTSPSGVISNGSHNTACKSTNNNRVSRFSWILFLI